MSLEDRAKEFAEETRNELDRKRLVPTSFSRGKYLEQKFTQAMDETIEEVAKKADRALAQEAHYLYASEIRELKIVEN